MRIKQRNEEKKTTTKRIEKFTSCKFSHESYPMYLYLFSSILTGIFDRRVKTMCVFHFDALWFSFVRTIGPARTTDSPAINSKCEKIIFIFSHSSSYRFFSVLVLSCEAQSVINTKSIEKSNIERMRHHNNCIPNWTVSSRQFKCLNFMNDDDDRCVKCLL